MIMTGTAEELIAAHAEQSPLDNGISLMGLSLILIGNGHYREGVEYTLKTAPPEGVELKMPEPLNRETARAAYLEAAIRAKPLYEQASTEMAGPAETYWVMEAYFEMVEMARNGTVWADVPDQGP